MYEDRNCTNCKHAYIRDIGYSSYTIEGHLFGCLIMKFDEVSYEKYESHDSEPYTEAIECDSFREGSPNHFDVEDRFEGRNKPFNHW